MSCFTIGYSSWLTAADEINKAEIQVSIGDVTEPNLRNAISYIQNSEKGFDYFSYDNNYYFKETSYSIRLKISPILIENYISTYKSVPLKFGLQYSYPSSDKFDIFSNSNEYIIAPSRVLYSLDLNPSFYIESEECQYNSYQSGANTTYELDSTISIFGTENSLYSFTKKYQKSSEYIYLTAKYDFEIKESFIANIERYKNLQMSFYLSIGSSVS